MTPSRRLLEERRTRVLRAKHRVDATRLKNHTGDEVRSHVFFDLVLRRAALLRETPDLMHQRAVAPEENHTARVKRRE